MKLKYIFLSIIFLIVFLNPVVASDGWQRINNLPDVDWQVSADQEIIGVMRQPIGNSFLISNTIEVRDNFSWQFNFIPEQGFDHNIVWGFIDENNYYQLHFAHGSIWVNRFIDGQEILARGISLNWQLNSEYLIKIVRRNGLLSIYLNDYEVIRFDDLTYDEFSIGKFGFKLSAGNVFPVESHFSNLIFLDENIISLPIKKFLQNDPLWESEEYDHALLWSENPTIADWGCALTSAAMVLNYFGFDNFNGGELNPSSLNDWLKNQPDGYIADGLVNWWAITRLVNQISEESGGLPKLEFRVIKNDLQVFAEMMIRSNNPLIAQVPGHFIVLNGFDEDSDEFTVVDPLFDKERSSDYEEINSLRFFQPSFTDLSYLVVVHDPGSQVVIKNNNEVAESLSFFEEINSLKFGLTVLPKPAEGEYLIEGNDIFSVYAYSSTAELTVFKLKKNKKIKVNFKKNEKSEINYFYEWEDFLLLVNNFYKDKKISKIAKDRIEERMSFIKQEESEDVKKRHLNYLNNLLDFYANFSDEQVILKLKEIISLTSL